MSLRNITIIISTSFLLHACFEKSTGPSNLQETKISLDQANTSKDGNTDVTKQLDTANTSENAQETAIQPTIADASTEITEASMDLFNQASALLASDNQGALQKLEQAIQESPANVKAVITATDILSQQGELKKAEQHLKNLHALLPDNEQVAMKLSLQLRSTKNTAQAYDLITFMLDKHPDSLPIKNELASILVEQKKLKKAENLALQVLRKDETNIDAMLNLGTIYYHQKKFELAILAATNVESIKPEEARAYHLKGFVKLAQKDPVAALDALKKAAKYAAYNPFVHLNLASLLRSQGDAQSALEHIQIAYKMRPSNIAIGIELGNSLRATGQYEKAIEQYKKIIKSNPDNALLLFNLGVLYLDNEIQNLDVIDRYKTAVDYLKKYLEIAAPTGKSKEDVETYIETAERELKREERRREREQKRAERKKRQEEQKRLEAQQQDANSDGDGSTEINP